MVKVVRKTGPGERKLLAMLAKLGAVHARVGFMENAKYPDKNGTPAAYVAVIHENGVEELNIPPRPFMGPTAEKKADEWAELARQGAEALAKGGGSVRAIMEIIAGAAENDVKETLESIQSPELHADTVIARVKKKEHDKGHVESFTKPLIESGYLISSVTHEVTEGTYVAAEGEKP